MRIERRPFALALTIGLHAVLLMLLLIPPRERLETGRGTKAVAVFATRAISEPTVDDSTASPPKAAVTPMQVVAPAPVPAYREVVDPTLVANRDGRTSAAVGADPFSNPGLPSPGAMAAPPSPGDPSPAQVLIDGLFAGIVLETPLIACTTLTASFVTTVNGDGSLSDVRFISGSLGAPLGERLAHALEAKIMFPPSTDGSSRRIIIGPVELTLPKRSGQSVEMKDEGQCKG